MTISTTVLLLALVITVGAGIVTGMAGFGFSVVGTMALATVTSPGTAVAFMLIPIVAANASLIQELDPADISPCIRRFGLFIAAAFVGTMLGMMVLSVLPERPLRVSLGLLALGFVATRQRAVPIPGRKRATERCFVETPLAMTGIGGVSGLIFGSTNLGIQVVAYVKSCNLSHGVFAGVIGLIFVGISTLRVVAAFPLGLYPDLTFVGVSTVAVIPAFVGVAAGARLRKRITTRRTRYIVLVLVTLIGIRLLQTAIC